MGEAIGVCLKAAKSDTTARPAIILASILSSGQPSEEDFQRAEPLLSKALENHKNNPDLLFSLANVRIRQEKAEKAIELYQQVLGLNPKHLLTLNNLATLLSEKPDRRSEALQYIDRAIELAGTQAGLMDTKGMILVFDDKADEGVQCLEKAASSLSPDPRYHFHLAVAYHRTGKSKKAREALQNAQNGDLTGKILTPTDRKLLSELEQELR